MRIIAVLLAVAALVPGAAGAEGAPPGSPFDVNLAIDLPLTLGAAAASVVPFIFRGEVAAPACGLSCNPDSVNPIDRMAIGRRVPGAGLTSDILYGAAVVLPVAFDLIDVVATRPGDRFTGFWKDMVVLAQVAAVDNLLNSMVKYAVRRPRPFAYDLSLDPAERTSASAGLSFYSGHASTSFALATAYSTLFSMRHPRSRLRIPVWIGMHLLAATIAVLRVESGNHFWTDIVVGGAVGSGVGLMVTHLHRRRAGTEGSRKGYAVRILPMAVAGGGGLTLSLQER